MSIIRDMQVRFPEAITVNHGPAPLLARFFLRMDQYFRDRGVRVMIRYDVDELVRLNRAESAAGRWYPLPRGYDPALNDLTPANCFWICGFDGAGDAVVAHAVRIYDWPDSTLADHASELIYGDRGEQGACIIDCPTAYQTTGSVYFGGAAWTRPDYRRHGFGCTLPQISRGFAYATYGTEWLTGFVKRELCELNLPEAYGYPEVTLGIRFPGSPWGDLDFGLVRQHSGQLLEMIEGIVTAPRVELPRAA